MRPSVLHVPVASAGPKSLGRHVDSARMPRRTLPQQWAGWQSIQGLDLAQNQLSGPLPDAWGKSTFPMLNELNLVCAPWYERLSWLTVLYR